MRSMAHAAMAAVFLTGAAQASPVPQRTPPMKVLADAKPLPAWTVFCEANPQECAVDTAQPASIVLTPAVWKEIESVNAKVNASIAHVTDRGDLILDNKEDRVLPWYRTGYVFIKRESQDKQAWVSLGGAVAPEPRVAP